MINPRAIATLGIGFGPRLQADLGLFPIEVIIDHECGTICCSIIIGKFALGCAPITAPYTLSFGCSPIIIPPEPPEPPIVIGGGGGGPYPSTVNYHTPRSKGAKTVTIVVNFEDQKWNTSYMIMGSRKQFKVGFESITNVSSKINIEVQAIHKTNKIVTVSFNPD